MRLVRRGLTPCQAEPDREPLGIQSRQGAPDRNPQKMPLDTRRSSTRGMPLGLLGNGGSITRHSKSVRLYRLMLSLNQKPA